MALDNCRASDLDDGNHNNPKEKDKRQPHV
jgi:hypothetical protein